METNGKKWRYAFMITVVVAAAAVFCARLAQWQLGQHEYYEDIALTSTEYTIQTDAVRGEIFDVNGKELAVNKTGYRVSINKLYMPDEELNEYISQLLDLLERSGSKWIDELPINMDSKGNYSFAGKKEEEIEELKSKDNLNMNPYSTADECMMRLVEKYGCEKYDPALAKKIISIRYNMDKTGYSKGKPYVVADDISERSMSLISEKMQSVKGIETQAVAVRKYENSKSAPHIVGITGLISEDEYTELKAKGYGYTDEIGKSGVESAFEDQLKGKPGSKTYNVGPENQVELINTENSKPGNSIYLTIDIKYQDLAMKALEEAVKEAKAYSKTTGEKHTGEDCVGASVVVLNVKDFSVLCAASYPSYDLNNYYKDYTKLADNKALPLVNRAFYSALAPGSTFKPMVASAALQEKAINTKTHIECDGIYTKNGLRLRCMSSHGSISVFEGIRDSCNVFFAETARLLGINKMNDYSRRVGLGVKTGIETGESAGTLAGPEYSEMMGTDWLESSVSPAGIGQSDNQFTTLQLATYAATLANGGTRLKPHVVDKIVSYSGDKVVYQSKAEVQDNFGVSKENLDNVKKGMNMAANTYESLLDFPLQIAGKTGTAENSGSDHANFICFAPYKDPQIAIAVMVEHGAKSYVAVNVAKKIMTEYFGLDKKNKDKKETSGDTAGEPSQEENTPPADDNGAVSSQEENTTPADNNETESSQESSSDESSQEENR